MIYVICIVGAIILLFFLAPFYRQFLEKKSYDLLEKSLNTIEAAILLKLFKIHPERFSRETAFLLSKSIVGEIFMIPPTSEKEENFRELNEDFIRRETQQALKIEEIHEAVSIAYVAQCMLIGRSMRPDAPKKFPITLDQIVMNANDLGIHTIHISELGSNPAHTIVMYAANFFDKCKKELKDTGISDVIK